MSVESPATTIPRSAARELAPPPVVRLHELTKRFPVRRGWRSALRHPFRDERKTAVDRVSCDVRAGEFFGLLGPNGAGKTTLFKMLATLVVPDAGTASVCGHDLVREPDAVRRVLTPVIADERSLSWRLSAAENLRLFGALYGLRREEARGRAEQLLDTVGLAGTGRAIVGTFSSGMKQRLLIARALLARPRVLLLDEPTRSLDPLSARAFRQFLREDIAAREGCSVLLATHNAEEALELCDRVAVLDRGRLLAVGPAAELAAELADERYRLWTTSPTHPALDALVRRGLAADLAVGASDADGWTAVEMEVPGGAARSAEVIASLADAGVAVARFERVQLTLADLIERIIQRRRED